MEETPASVVETAATAPPVPPDTEAVVQLPESPPVITEEGDKRGFQRWAILLMLGWAGTNIGLAVGELPLKFYLKDHLSLKPEAVAAFFALGQFTNYIKPVAGILVDAIPLFGTRRRWYLLLSLLATSLFWILICYVPQTYGSMLRTYTILYMTVMVTSTTLGGVMVEIGQRYRAAGRLTAQRIAMFRVGTLIGGPIGGRLAEGPFPIAAFLASLLHFLLVPLFFFNLKEKKEAQVDRRIIEGAKLQLGTLAHSNTLLLAAFLVFLLAASPGFGTPLLFHQTDNLHFSKPFIGNLSFISAATGILGTILYFAVCRRLTLKALLAWSIVLHAIGTITYLGYHSREAAILITALNGLTVTLATLPIYDLAARATPRGSEAMGYAVMMSVWNLTNALSDWTGSLLFSSIQRNFALLVWINTGTTALILFVLPFLPLSIINKREGEHIPEGGGGH